MQLRINRRTRIAALLTACAASLALAPGALARPAEESSTGDKANAEVIQRNQLGSILVAPSGTWYAKDFWGRWYQSTDEGRSWQRMG
jgi:hypothetical protein